jgi:segregation and condensation protein B
MSMKHKSPREANDDSSAKPSAQPPQGDSSLAALSRAFVKVIGRRSRRKEETPSADELEVAGAERSGDEPQEAQTLPLPPAGADDGPPPSPRMIVEGAIFVGRPDNAPLSSRQIAALVRGISPREVDQIVRELNAVYDEEGCAFRIESAGPGYRLELRPQYAALRDKFYGRVRQARLSQAAIDVLAIVAYNQPVDREEVDRLRGFASAGVLRQLVQRELLRLERSEDRPRKPFYHTTDRFLNLFGLESLEELPQSQDFERAGG